MGFIFAAEMCCLNRPILIPSGYVIGLFEGVKGVGGLFRCAVIIRTRD